MAVAVVMKFPAGTTLEQYDEVVTKMGFQPRGSGAPHALFHWATATDDSITVTDVWESKQAFEEFAAKQIGPLTAEAGITGPPEMTFHEVHNYLTAG